MDIMHVDGYDVDSPPPFIDEPNILGPLETLTDDEAVDDQLLEEKNDDEWYQRSLHERWIFVVERLVNKAVRWDDHHEPDDEWDPGVQVLDTKERESLAEIDDRDTAFPTVLHRLAANFGSDNFNILQPRTQARIVEYLLQEHRKRKARAQATTDSPEDPILTRAFANQNDEFIRFIIKNFSSHLPDLLSDQDTSGANCLHYVFKKHLPEAVDDWIRRSQPRKAARAHKPLTLDLSKTLHYLIFLINSARPQCIVAGDADGNTPMHYAMSYKVCRMPIRTDQYKTLVLQLIEVGDKSEDGSRQFNNAEQSPYLYFDHTRREFTAQNARLRAQKPTQSTTASSIFKRPGREEMNKQKEPGHEALTSKASKPKEAPPYISHAIVKEALGKWPAKDNQISMRSSVDPRVLPTASQQSKDILQKNPQISKPRAVDEAPLMRLSRRDTIGLAENTQEDASPVTRSSSPALESKAANSGMLNSARATLSIKEPFPAEVMTRDKQAGRDPSSRPSKSRVDGAEEDIGKKKPEEPKEDYDICIEKAKAVHQQLKLHYIRNKPDMEAKELLYGRVASGKS